MNFNAKIRTVASKTTRPHLECIGIGRIGVLRRLEERFVERISLQNHQWLRFVERISLQNLRFVERISLQNHQRLRFVERISLQNLRFAERISLLNHQSPRLRSLYFAEIVLNEGISLLWKICRIQHARSSALPHGEDRILQRHHVHGFLPWSGCG